MRVKIKCDVTWRKTSYSRGEADLWSMSLWSFIIYRIGGAGWKLLANVVRFIGLVSRFHKYRNSAGGWKSLFPQGRQGKWINWGYWFGKRNYFLKSVRLLIPSSSPPSRYVARKSRGHFEKTKKSYNFVPRFMALQSESRRTCCISQLFDIRDLLADLQFLAKIIFF